MLKVETSIPCDAPVLRLSILSVCRMATHAIRWALCVTKFDGKTSHRGYSASFEGGTSTTRKNVLTSLHMCNPPLPPSSPPSALLEIRSKKHGFCQQCVRFLLSPTNRNLAKQKRPQLRFDVNAPNGLLGLAVFSVIDVQFVFKANKKLPLLRTIRCMWCSRVWL